MDIIQNVYCGIMHLCISFYVCGQFSLASNLLFDGGIYRSSFRLVPNLILVLIWLIQVAFSNQLVGLFSSNSRQFQLNTIQRSNIVVCHNSLMNPETCHIDVYTNLFQYYISLQHTPKNLKFSNQLLHTPSKPVFSRNFFISLFKERKFVHVRIQLNWQYCFVVFVNVELQVLFVFKSRLKTGTYSCFLRDYLR